MERAERHSRWVVLAVGAGALLLLLTLYWSTLSYHYGGDGLLFAGSVEAVRAGNTAPVTMRVFLHAHHVLYGPFGLLAHLPWDPRIPAVTTMAMGNGLLAVVTVAFFFSLCRRLRAGRGGAALASLTLALSFAFWLFAVHAETYLLAQFGAVLFVRALVAEPGGKATAGWELRSGLLLALCWTVAVGGHLVNVLLVVPLVAWELGRGRRRRALVAVSAAALLVGLAYLAAMWATGAELTPSGAIEWVRPRGDYVDASTGGALSTLRALALGFGAGPGGRPLSGPLTGLFLIGAGLALYARRSGAAADPDHAGRPGLGGSTVLLLGSWFGAFLIFFSIWDAGNVEFALWLVVPLVLALAILDGRAGACAGARALRVAWLVVVLAMGSWNWATEIAPQSDPTTNRYLHITRWVGRTMGERDLLVVSGLGPAARYKFYLPYFAHRTAYWLADRSGTLGEERWRAELADLRAAVERGERRIFCLDELFAPETTARLRDAGVSPDLLDALTAEFQPTTRTALPDGDLVELYEWRPPAEATLAATRATD